MFLPAYLVAIVPVSLLIVIYRYFRPVARARWFRNAQHLWDSYYCARDDVAFKDSVYSNPENFVAYCFSANRES